MIAVATPADLGGILAVERAGFDETSQWTEAAWAAELAAPDRLVLVHHNPHGDVEAAATFQVVAEVADLHRVVVHPMARRRGLATVLVAEGLAWSAGRGAERMLLEVEATNAPARGLYSDLGFTTIADRRDYYGPGRDALVLERCLEAMT